MSPHCVFGVVLLASAGLLAQQPTTPMPKRSLADGLVRHRIETERLAPPQLRGGLELGIGDGPMVLLLRRQDGSLSATELQRGPGSHGAPAELRKLEAIVEKVAEPGAQAKKPADPAPATTRIRIERTDDKVVATPSIGGAVATFDREHLQPALTALFATGKGQPHETQLEIQVGPGSTVQDVLLVWEVAWLAGFRLPLFNDIVPPGPAPAALGDTIAGLPAQFGWEGRSVADLPMKLYDEEVLVLFDGPTPFREFSMLLRECAARGIWQIGLIGQQDPKVRWKLPTHLATCR